MIFSATPRTIDVENPEPIVQTVLFQGEKMVQRMAGRSPEIIYFFGEIAPMED